MKIKNLHQPYLFKRNNQINLVVSEFLPQKLNFYWGETLIEEDYWKLYHLDSNYKKTIIDTPSEIVHDGITYHVIQECNGFINGNLISYVIGGHTKKDQDRLIFFLVQGTFDFDSKKVNEIQVKDEVRTGFIRGDKYTVNMGTRKLYKNTSDLVLDCSELFEEVVRIIPVFEKQIILVTGYVDKNFKTIAYDLELNKIFVLEGIENKHIYKSSILSDGLDNIFSFTDKVFDGEAKADYLLNIQHDYLLKEL